MSLLKIMTYGGKKAPPASKIWKVKLLEPFYRYNFGDRSRLDRTFSCQQFCSSCYPAKFFAGFLPAY
jgi:hypothetical protein